MKEIESFLDKDHSVQFLRGPDGDGFMIVYGEGEILKAWKTGQFIEASEIFDWAIKKAMRRNHDSLLCTRHSQASR